jgi:protease YdgD
VLKHPGRFAEAGEVVFVAGWRAGEAAADARGAALAIHPGFRSGVEAARVRVADDLALLTLERPLPGIAPIPVGPLPEAGALTILGYRADRPHIASRLGPCPVTTRAREAIVLACAVIQGTSGAPVLVETEAGWRVVGVVSAASGGGTIAPRPDRWDALNALSP